MIYLDHAALAPTLPSVLAAMVSAAEGAWGNAQSRHAAGRRAAARIEEARAEVAAYLGCAPEEIFFASSGGAALARALDVVAGAARSGPLALARTEHPALLRLAQATASAGGEVRWLPAPRGRIDADACAPMVRDAAVVVFSALNHELGTAPAIAEMAGVLARAPRALLVVDAVQAAAWIDLAPVCALGALVALASQKLGGPPGAAALRVPPAIARRLPPDDSGASAWLAVIGLGEACRLARAEREQRLARARALMATLRARLEGPPFHGSMNGDPATWLGPVLSVSFPGRASGDVSAALDLAGVCVSRGSACVRQGPTGSPTVAAACPDEPWRAATATRWSAGFATGTADVDGACRALAEVFPALPRRAELLPPTSQGGTS